MKIFKNKQNKEEVVVESIKNLEAPVVTEKKNKEESYCVYSVKVLEELEAKLKSEQPKEKKVRKVIPYVCDWNNYDVFSYKLISNPSLLSCSPVNRPL